MGGTKAQTKRPYHLRVLPCFINTKAVPNAALNFTPIWSDATYRVEFQGEGGLGSLPTPNDEKWNGQKRFIGRANTLELGTTRELRETRL